MFMIFNMFIYLNTTFRNKSFLFHPDITWGCCPKTPTAVIHPLRLTYNHTVIGALLLLVVTFGLVLLRDVMYSLFMNLYSDGWYSVVDRGLYSNNCVVLYL